MGDNNFYKLIVEHSSVGYSYNKIIYDDNGEPIDYEFIKVNKSYESMIGIKAKDLIGKRISQIYKFAKKQKLNWNKFHSNILTKHNKKEFECYFDFVNKYYRIKVHYPKKGHIMISLTDISREVEETEKLKIQEKILFSTMEFTQELLTNENLNMALAKG